MHPQRLWLRVVALTLLYGVAGIAYAEQTSPRSKNAPKPTKQPPVYVQDRQTKETMQLDQLPPIPGCKQMGVEVTSQGMVQKCFDHVPVWKD